MKIDFEHLGCIEKGSVELNDFTIFCGKNNSGKTYAMYSLHGLLNHNFNSIKFEFVKPIIDKLKKNGNYELDVVEIITQHKEEMLKHIEQYFKDYLPILFGVTIADIFNTKIQLKFSDEEIENRIKKEFSVSQFGGFEFDEPYFGGFDEKYGKKWELLIKFGNLKIELFLKNIETAEKDASFENLSHEHISSILNHIMFFELWSIGHSFLLPAERAGINLFYKELFSIRNFLIQKAQNDNIDQIGLLNDILKSRYADPIKSYLQFINSIGSIKKKESNYKNYAKTIQENVLDGEYQVDDFGNISFKMNLNKKNLALPLHFSSSTVKTLFGLVFYLKHLAKEGDYLMIDEPELNLHPDNQRKVARVLAQLVNAGLKIVVSTHSDYFIRELNNLIMLKKDFTGSEELKNKYGYQDSELLDDKRVSAYLFDNGTIERMITDEDEGIIAETFDDVINNLNKSSNDIYYTMQDSKEVSD